MHVLFSNFHKWFLMELCMIVLGCLVQVMTWLPYSATIFSHEQRNLFSGQRASLSFRFNVTREADILGSGKPSSWNSERSPGWLLISPLHLLIDDPNKNKRSWSGTFLWHTLISNLNNISTRESVRAEICGPIPYRATTSDRGEWWWVCDCSSKHLLWCTGCFAPCIIKKYTGTALGCPRLVAMVASCTKCSGIFPVDARDDKMRGHVIVI